MSGDAMARLLAAAGWDAGSIRHKQLEDALDGARLAIVPLSSLPPSPEAGSGPAAPFRFRRYVNGTEMAEDVEITQASTVQDAFAKARAFYGRPAGMDLVLEHAALSPPIGTAPVAWREALDCQEYMPLSLKPMDDPNFDDGEHWVLDAQTAHVFKLNCPRDRAERVVAALNAATLASLSPAAPSARAGSTLPGREEIKNSIEENIEITLHLGDSDAVVEAGPAADALLSQFHISRKVKT